MEVKKNSSNLSHTGWTNYATELLQLQYWYFIEGKKGEGTRSPPKSHGILFPLHLPLIRPLLGYLPTISTLQSALPRKKVNLRPAVCFWHKSAQPHLAKDIWGLLLMWFLPIWFCLTWSQSQLAPMAYQNGREENSKLPGTKNTYTKVRIVRSQQWAYRLLLPRSPDTLLTTWVGLGFQQGRVVFLVGIQRGTDVTKLVILIWLYFVSPGKTVKLSWSNLNLERTHVSLMGDEQTIPELVWSLGQNPKGPKCQQTYLALIFTGKVKRIPFLSTC